jgi:wobble nucleotide-excising tRNase
MIESIHLAKTATYGDPQQSLTGLKTFNYIYGSNGSGKTTISRVVANPGDPAHANCNIAWKGGSALDTFVYNRDFVAANFGPGPIKGVFTLGKQSVEDAEALRQAAAEVARQTAEIMTLTTTLNGHDGFGGKKAELETLEQWLQEKCWTQKLKHDAKLSGAFEGYRNDRSKFKRKVLEELARVARVDKRPTLADMEARAETVFGASPTSEALLALPSASSLLALEANPILPKIVVGSKDVDIAAMIEKLGASDWVKQGRPFFQKNDGDCPFCQQPAPVSLEDDLGAYFDSAFVADTQAIDALAIDYVADGKSLLSVLDSATASPSTRVDKIGLQSQRDAATAKIAANTLLIESKRKEPSRPIVLDGMAECAAAVTATIAKANAAISVHNATVANIRAEKEKLTAQVWRYLIEEELAADLTDYATRKEGFNKAVANLEGSITDATNVKLTKEGEIRTLEKSSASVQPTVDEINGLLRSYGFRSFSLARMGKGNTYALRRIDETDARETLSEGEKSFVTFLYFYHLLQGSPDDSGTVSPRVAVFDDPVSSLDSDVLFIVSSLIHRLMEQVRAKAHPVKQIFILTHNVHFHREVTFNGDRPQGATIREESFWVVRKPGGHSLLEPSTVNPVSSSYEMLWAEIRRKDLTVGSVQNTLRRILESYFKILGGVDFKSLDKHFEGTDKVVCKSLFSWINAGSHGFDDNLHFAIDTASVENHLRVFKAIFEKSAHGAHYRMMMRESPTEPPLGGSP